MSEERQKSDLNERVRAGEGELEDKLKGGASSRARNRTVMLTPDVTGHVRSLLHNESNEKPLSDPLSQLLPPLSGATAPSAKPAELSHDLPEESEPAPDSRNNPSSRSAARTMFLERENLPQTFSPSSPPAISTPVPTTPPPSGKQNLGSQKPVATAMSAQPQPQRAPESPIVGFLISFDRNEFGEVYEVRAGRWLLTSRPTDHGDYILVDDSTISPLHAIIRASREGKIQVLDQLSEFGTGYTPQGEGDEREISGTMVSVGHGDFVRFGKRYFVVCLVPKTPSKKREGNVGLDE